MSRSNPTNATRATDIDLFDGSDPIEALNVPVLAEFPFDPDLQELPAPGDVPDRAAELAQSVDRRFESIWAVDVPDSAVDIRGLDSEQRYDEVEAGWEETPAGEQFHLAATAIRRQS